MSFAMRSGFDGTRMIVTGYAVFNRLKISSPMGMADVAAGEGALHTCKLRFVCKNLKS